MKIRHGHVSNSSSSSFIIDGSKISIKELATAMLDYQLAERANSSWCTDDHLEDTKNRIEKEKETLSQLPDNQGVVFFSINYDTYIHLDDDGSLLVGTCNNERWEQVFDGIRLDWKYADYYHLTDILGSTASFVHLFSGVKGRPLTRNEIMAVTKAGPQHIRCPLGCFSLPWLEQDTDTIRCPVCRERMWPTPYSKAIK